MKIPKVIHLKFRIWTDPRDWELAFKWKNSNYIHIGFVSVNVDWSWERWGE